MPLPVNQVTRSQRAQLLAKIEAFATEFLADLERRNANKNSYWCYMNFCTPVVMDLIAWERIHAVDLAAMPSAKHLFVLAAKAARHSIDNYGHRDKDMDRGAARRTFNEISEAELAANILPRLEQVLYCWGVSYDHCDGRITERELNEEEVDRLTRQYGDA